MHFFVEEIFFLAYPELKLTLEDELAVDRRLLLFFL
jgi:hypothetical protein